MLFRSLAFLCLALLPQFAHASSEPLAENVMAEVMKDLSAPYTPQEKLAGKMCLNGASVDGFQGDIIEYWANLECPYCDIKEPLAAQRDNPNLCIVVRHSPSASYGESVKKSLVYETLMQLHSVYGCLDVVDTENLYFYHLHTAKEVLPGKEAFDRYCLARFSGEDETFWKKSFIYGTLDKLLIPALESGVDPEKALWKFDKYTFPLKGCLLFFDELQEEFDAIYKIANVLSLLKAARKFTEWEENNRPQR